VALNLQQIRDFVRSHLDIEIEDLTDDVLDVFIAEGFQRCYRAERRWPFYLKRWTLSTTAAEDTYDLDDVASDIEEIAAIKGPRWNLKWLGADESDWAWPDNVTQSSEPTHFNLEHRTLYLYPTPDDVYSLTLKGYRKPTDWIGAGAGAEPDIYEDLHNTIAKWALAMAYQQQDDPEMASIFERQFADELNLFRRRLNATPMPQPLVMNGNGRRSRPLAMRYDWEF
jgi:hypothetical protein